MHTTYRTPSGRRLTRHCAIRTTTTTVELDDDWFDLTREAVDGIGIEPDDDPAACRWMTLRDQASGLDLAATVIRQDGRWAGLHGDSDFARSACAKFAHDQGPPLVGMRRHGLLPPLSGRSKSRNLRILITRKPNHGSHPFAPYPRSAVIAHLQRASNTAGLLAYLYGLGERGDRSEPRLVGGDCHGAPADLFTHSDNLPYLAHALDAPVERLGTGAPERPVWVCSVRSDPRQRDLSDAQWADVARRVVGVTVAPGGDPDACRWIALRNQPRQVHIVATLAREDGSLHNAYRDAFHLQTECRRIAAELGHLPASPTPTLPLPEKSMPLTVTIAAEPSGAVVARDGDSLAESLLTHAGFAYANDWHGPRHRLPTSMGREEQAAVASHAAQMLRAARYTVDLDPALDSAPADPQSLGDQLLAITDRIRGAELADALAPLLHAEHGVVERVREALEAAGEQITDLDDEAYQLADRFGFASEFLTAAQDELLGADVDLRRVAVPVLEQAAARSAAVHDARSVALATSPAATQASAPRSHASPTPGKPPTAGPARNSAPRTR
jgi:hypothetical protein